MIEKWALLPVGIALGAVLAVCLAMFSIGAVYIPMMAGPEDARK